MRLTRIVCKGLFGVFDHDIYFKTGEDVAIIHGPNGFGKTVILKMIGAILSRRPGIFHQIPFTEFWLYFDDGSRQGATRKSEVNQGRPELLFQQTLADGTVKNIKIPAMNNKELTDFIDRYVPWPRDGNGWRDQLGRYVSLEDALERYPEARDRLPAKLARSLSFGSEGLKVFFVETNRLLASHEMSGRSPHERYVEYAEIREREHGRSLRVTQYSKELTRRIQAVLADYAKHSQESDRTFPARLVNFLRTEETALSNKDILAQMQDLEASRTRLINLGFLDTEQGLSDLTEGDVDRAPEALTIYVKDMRAKLRVFDDLAVRVGMLIDVVNGIFEYKRVSIDREHGFHVTNSAGTAMNVANLSSGEQHQLVLLYELLFLVPKNGLVLIDEPEISLHVGWQARFLSDLLDILKITGAQALVATHAPAIIGNRWDLTVELKGPSSVQEKVDAV